MPKYNTGRCIPVCEGVHSKEKSYLNLSVVLESSTGNSYTSKKKVPVGMELSNEEYWALSAVYNSQLNTKANKEDPYIWGSFSQNRRSGTAVGINSHTEGTDNQASGENSHAEGRSGIASGECSHSEGYASVAGGESAHAEGDNTRAEGDYAHAEGESTKANGDSSHAEGRLTTAAGIGSHAEGYATVANGSYSHAEGCNTTATGNQHIQGHFNSQAEGEAPATGTSSVSAFCIGNGTKTVASNAFRVNYNGQIYAKSSTINTGADYAEFFEWKDGNPDSEDRVGLFVTFSDGDKIKVADRGDYILGIVSGNPSVIGNGDMDWSGRFIRDNFNRFIMQGIDVEDPDTGIISKSTTYVQNPEYNPEQVYLQRFDRKEWNAIGMVGVLPVYDDGTCQPGEYCICADGGIASAAENYSFGTYRVIGRITENIIRIVLK